MSNVFSLLLIFIIALVVGIFIGKLLFSAKSQSEKTFLEQKLNDLKEQSLIEKAALDKQLQNTIDEKVYQIIQTKKVIPP